MKYDETACAIGRRIREIRASKHMKREELAELCSLKKESLGEIETGKRWASIRLLFTIADAMNVTLSYLVKGIKFNNKTE